MLTTGLESGTVPQKATDSFCVQNCQCENSELHKPHTHVFQPVFLLPPQTRGAASINIYLI